MPDAINAVPLDNIAHVIQVALTPVFLLSGIGALLNVFNTRLARVSDHVSHTADLLAADPQGEYSGLMRRHIRRLRRRVLALDAAIVLAALGGGTTCGAAFTLFVGATRNANTAFVLLLLFGSAELHGGRSRCLHRRWIARLARPRKCERTLATLVRLQDLLRPSVPG